jgi:hypothetical protein
MSEVYQCKYSFMVYHEINKVSIIIITIIINISIEQSSIVYTRSVHVVCFISGEDSGHAGHAVHD